MLTGKQKRFLRAIGSTIDPIVQVGKGGVGPNLIQQLDEALEAREVVKVRVLRNCLEEREEVAETLAQATKAEVAQQIGSNILFYRKSKKPQIELP
ncbi:MAG: ribosome assembly RNA-binding protein YhbY [Clostridia bacterium]|nr:ribosome assembly RNA-binding protein YhbY [Clostridia bacterium]